MMKIKSFCLLFINQIKFRFFRFSKLKEKKSSKIAPFTQEIMG